MRVGIICYPSIGGSGLVATELAAGLAATGIEVHVISYATPFKLRSYERNIAFHSVDPINYPLFNQSLYTFALTAKIIEVAQDHKLDVIHAHYSIPHSLCAHLAKEITGMELRIITTLHGTDVTVVGQDRPLYPINRYGIEKSDVVTTVSEFQRKYTLNEFRLDKEIQVIYNFIDPDVFHPGAAAPCTRACLADSDESIIMHISNFRQPKNPRGVIHAFAEARKAVNARLILVGDGPEIVEIKHLCKELGVCKNVSFLGQIDNVETIIPLADCVLQPSYRESFGMVLLEAMSCGVPAVASSVDGIPEVICDGQTGLLADPDDYLQLGEHLVRLCSDEDLRKAMGEAGRRRAITEFHKDKIIPQYLACYETCCTGSCRN